MNKSGKYLVWTVLSVMGAFALGYIALNRGEQINALWIVVASVCIYLIAYRFYGLYIAKNVLAVDPTRMTPAVRHNDGLDYVPTDKKVLFGHHFAAIAGAGPLVGPVLAAQMGYLPGMIWLLAGWFSPVRCRILWCCLFLRAVTVVRWVSWSKKRWGQPPG